MPALDRPGLDSDAFMERLDVENRGVFAEFLHSLLKIVPDERKSTMELLAEHWLDAVA